MTLRSDPAAPLRQARSRLMADIAPGLDELAVAVAAPAVLLTDPAGPMHADGVQGWYVDDVRLLRRLEARGVPDRPGHGPPTATCSRPTPSPPRSRSPPSAPPRSTSGPRSPSDLAPVSVVRQQAGDRGPAPRIGADGLVLVREGTRLHPGLRRRAPASHDGLVLAADRGSGRPRPGSSCGSPPTAARSSPPAARRPGPPTYPSRPATSAGHGWSSRAWPTWPGCCCATGTTRSWRPGRRGT